MKHLMEMRMLSSALLILAAAAATASAQGQVTAVRAGKYVRSKVRNGFDEIRL